MKRISLGMLCLLVIALLLAGCGQASFDNNPANGRDLRGARAASLQLYVGVIN